MQFRVVRLESRNPLVRILLLIVIIALLAAFVTAGVALAAGAAVIGGGAYLVRRIFGGRASSGVLDGSTHSAMAGREVFAPGTPRDAGHLTRSAAQTPDPPG